MYTTLQKEKRKISNDDSPSDTEPEEDDSLSFFLAQVRKDLKLEERHIELVARKLEENLITTKSSLLKFSKDELQGLNFPAAFSKCD